MDDWRVMTLSRKVGHGSIRHRRTCQHNEGDDQHANNISSLGAPVLWTPISAIAAALGRLKRTNRKAERLLRLEQPLCFVHITPHKRVQ